MDTGQSKAITWQSSHKDHEDRRDVVSSNLANYIHIRTQFKSYYASQVWWCTPLILALEMQRQMDL